MSPDTAVSVCGLSKSYGDVRAVDGLDLDVRAGEVYGFLGRNGAGKTTTIRMLVGLVRPSRGEITILGRRITTGETEVFGRVGYLVESASAYPNLTVAENLEIQRRLTGRPASSVDEAIRVIGLSDLAGRRAGKLSLGNKQRLSLARALLHDPQVLVLDEPANALDPAGIVEVREMLRRLADERGVTVFMSSHILAEVAHLADRIGIIHQGRLLQEIDRQNLEAAVRTFVMIRSSDAPGAERLLSDRGINDIETDQDRVDVLRVFDRSMPVAEIARLLVGAGIDIHELTPMREDLESYFLRLTESPTHGEESS